MQYRKEIDGLRAIAVLPVMFFHAGFSFFSGGYIGVDVFFVISGYLITSIILGEKEYGNFSISNFYERRARRILPALFLVTLVTIPFAWNLLPPDELKDYYQSVAAVSLFSSNILFWLESGYFDTLAELKPLLHTWSLAVEEQYYLVFPLLVLLIWRLGKRYILPMLGLIALLSLLLAQWGSENSPSAAFYLLPTRFWELMIGSITAFIMFYPQKFEIILNVSLTAKQILSAVGLSLIFYAAIFFNSRTPFPGVFALIPTTGTALIILYGLNGTLTNRLLCNSGLVLIGLISYSAYLWHQPVLAFARWYQLDKLSPLLLAALLLISLVMAYFSWKYVEKPFRRKHGVSRKVVFKFAVIGSLGFFLTGLSGHHGNSFLYLRAAELEIINTEINTLSNERLSLIRRDECHFNDQSSIGIDEFTGKWDCWNDAERNILKRIPFVVTGDSFAADIALSLKLNGFLPLQIGGDDCSLNPDFQNENCRQIFLTLLDRIKGNPYFKYLIISNQYEEDELSLSSLKTTIDYWEQSGLVIFFVTDMPRFPTFKKAATRKEDVEPDYTYAERSERKQVIDYLKKRGVEVINRKEIYCSLTENCGYRDKDGTLLLVDFGHLSRVGAQRFGEALLSNSNAFESLSNTRSTVQ
jgi:peptidoglycan/LPS O-acetylase OafA/YrhL